MLAAVVHWWTRIPLPRPGTAPSSEHLEAASKVLATLAAIGVAAAGDAPGRERLVAVVALVLCVAGDVALLRVIDRFVVGLGAFLLAHVAFIVLFVRNGLDLGGRTIVVVVLGCVLEATAGRRILLAARRHAVALTVPVGLYLVTILTMAALGWSTHRPWVWLGVSAFVVSDAVLGWEEFVDRRAFMAVAVMSTYHLAIFSLALSL